MSIYRSLPDRPSLGHLKGQAKALLSAVRGGDPDARRRFEEAHPRGLSALSKGAKLSDAQLVLAREYDFASWPALHDYVASGASDGKARVREALEQLDLRRVTRLLAEQPQLIAARFSPHNDTPLHLAAKAGSASLVELLAARGAQLGARNSWGGTPMICALIEGHGELAELLLARGAQALTLLEAAGLGRVELLRSFWDATGKLRPDATARFGSEISPGVWRSAADTAADEREVVQSAFEYACRNGRMEAARFLLERGAAVNAAGFFGAEPLHWAAARGKDEMVRFLVARGADLGRRDPKFAGTAFGWAREFGHQSTLSVLRELGYAPDIWEAASTGDAERLTELLDSDPSRLEAQKWGTPLCEACAWGQENTARLLLERGARIDVTTRDGKLPIELARDQGLDAIVSLIDARTGK
jgi:ankyrin repeat protein